MKKKIINIIEAVILAIILILVLFGKYGIYGTHLSDVNLNFRNVQSSLFPRTLVLFTVWNLVMCIISAIAKNKHKDGKIHTIISVLGCIFALFFGIDVLNTKAYTHITAIPDVVMALYIAIIIISVAKRSALIVPRGEPVIVQNISEGIQNSADEIKKYKDLLDSGVLTQEEFDAKKKQLLGL